MGETVQEVDYYQLLGVRSTASMAQIRSAYRSLAKVMHPDAGGTVGTFQQLHQAYETLSDPQLRSEYDAGRARPEATNRWTGRVRRTRTFGGDPDFVPKLPELDPQTLPWWQEAQTAEPIMYVPLVVPGHAPAVVAFGGWLLLVSSVVLIDLSPLLFALWLLLVAAASYGVVRLVRRYLTASRVTKSFAAELGNSIEFGTPGQEQGELAERLTAQLLSKYLTKLPAARIFHGLRMPDSVFADVDHAVLCGRRLVLIESKLWLPGHYRANPDGSLCRNDHLFRGGVIRLPKAVAAYRKLLPDVEVRGIVLVYPSREGMLTTSGSADILALTPESFVRDVGAWLAGQPTTVDRDVFRTLRQQCAA